MSVSSQRKRWGSYLIAAGVAVWPVYVVLKVLAVPVEVEDVLPFHLAGVIPGTLLRRWELIRRLWEGIRPWR